MNASCPPLLLEFYAMIPQEEQYSPLAKEPYTVHYRFSLQTTIQQRDMVPSRIRPRDPVVFVPRLNIQTTISTMAQKFTLEAPLSPPPIFKQAFLPADRD